MFKQIKKSCLALLLSISTGWVLPAAALASSSSTPALDEEAELFFGLLDEFSDEEALRFEPFPGLSIELDEAIDTGAEAAAKLSAFVEVWGLDDRMMWGVVRESEQYFYLAYIDVGPGFQVVFVRRGTNSLRYYATST